MYWVCQPLGGSCLRVAGLTLASRELPNDLSRANAGVLAILNHDIACDQGCGIALTLHDKATTAVGEVIHIFRLL